MDNNLKPNYVKKIKRIQKGSIKDNSPYPEISASYHWLNIDFPYLHTHSEWEIFVVTGGKLIHTINNYKELCNTGYACLIRPTDCHCLEYAGKEEPQLINFMFSNEIAEELFKIYKDFGVDFSTDKPLHFTLSSSFMETMIQQSIVMQSAEKQIFERYSILTVNQLIAAFFSQNLIKNPDYPDWLNAFLRQLHNPKSFRLPLVDVAKYSPYSYPHLTKVFKQLTGVTLKEYMEKTKITYVKRLLRSTKKSILEISLDVGYDSVSSLNHNFKAITSMTPTQYRKKWEGNKTIKTDT